MPAHQLKRALLFATALAATTAGALAQTPPQLADNGASPEQIFIFGQGYRAPRAMSATKTDTPLIDVPQSVTVVTEQQILDQAANSIGEALRYVPGVTSAQGEGNRETLVLRGNATTGDFFVDGVRDDIQTYRDLYNIRQLEVFKGPNAMIFGRGGVGGIVNRVTKQADWTNPRELRVEGGSFEHARSQLDVGQALNETVALRVTGVYQYNQNHRDDVFFRRWGVNPTTSFRFNEDSQVMVGYEHFYDRRVADRGIPNRFISTTTTPASPVEPFEAMRSRFFGDPKNSPVRATTDAVNLAFEHRFSETASLRNRTRFADYDKFYQNIYPGAVNAAETTVSLLAYNDTTRRKNLFNQTDLNFEISTGAVGHVLLAGLEIGRQETDNRRLTGYFGADATAPTSIAMPIEASNVRRTMFWAPNATNADSSGIAKVAAGYVQDQVSLLPQLQIIAGIRFDRFTIDFTNNRTATTLLVTDNVWSPRAGIIYKPRDNISLYGAFSRTFQPRSGDQLTSLTATTAALAPEKFTNTEIGAKWDVSPTLNVAAAIYQLDRDNVIVLIDPANPGLGTELGGGQRTKGIEVSASGSISERLSTVVSYANQDGKFTRAISASVRAGAVLANMPAHNFSAWVRYQITTDLGAALGVNAQSRRFAAQDNLVVMPGFARADAAFYYNITDRISAQINIENLFDRKYFVNAHSNNNISPGSPTAFRLSLATNF